LPKYYYKPIVDKVEEIYLQNAKKPFFENGKYDLTITVVVEAKSEEESLQMRKGVTDIRMWELDHIEE
jgi:hypothetical protein